jgi:Uma2 family endonuclease
MGELKLTNIPYTFEEYLAIDTESENRYEYQLGEIWAMAGSTRTHNDICINATTSIRNQIKGRKCKVNMSDMRVEVQENGIYYYPDVVLTCHPDDLQDPLLNRYPSLVIEVLSNSTMKKDGNEKLRYYLQMPSLQYYLIVSQKEIEVKCYERMNDFWKITIYTDLAEVMELEKLNLSLLLNDLYEDIIF